MEKRTVCSRSRRLLLTAIAALFFLLPAENPLYGRSVTVPFHSHAGKIPGEFLRPVFKHSRTFPEVILIPEEKGWLISILLPYIVRETDPTLLPDLFVVPETPSLTCDRFLSSFKDRKILSFVNPERIQKDYGIRFADLEYFSLSDTPFKAALQLADAFTDSTPHVMLGSLKDPEQFIQAAIFAGQIGIPFVPLRNRVDRDALHLFFQKK
ncbi:hypothetical protein KKI24_04650, partial [bacterium]|nr:hypothetical protein [bacterium]